MPRALFRGRYAIAVADWNARGIPVSVRHLTALETQWQALRMFYIRRDDTFGLYDQDGSFKEDRFKTWPTARAGTQAGRAPRPESLTDRQGARSSRPSIIPNCSPLQHLRDHIAELRLGKFLNTIGADGFSRCPIMPFWTKTGRNQPSGRDKVFLLSLPSWMHGMIAPPPGIGLALLDWKAQEIGIAAGLSNDPALIADFQAGDPHMNFAIRAGLAPVGATAETHGEIRDKVKPISLGSQLRHVEIRRRSTVRQIAGVGGDHAGRTPPRLPDIRAMATEHDGAGDVRSTH